MANLKQSFKPRAKKQNGKKELQKTKATTFSNWYKSLPANEQIKKRDEICITCDFSTAKFYRITREEQIPSVLEQAAISAIVNQPIKFKSIKAGAATRSLLKAD
jgi:hypothetical protein